MGRGNRGSVALGKRHGFGRRKRTRQRPSLTSLSSTMPTIRSTSTQTRRRLRYQSAPLMKLPSKTGRARFLLSFIATTTGYKNQNGRGINTRARKCRVGSISTESRRLPRAVRSRNLKRCLFSSTNYLPWLLSLILTPRSNKEREAVGKVM